MHCLPGSFLSFLTGAFEQPIKALTLINEFYVLPICYLFNSN